jgi:hypothetical protein
MIHVRNLRKDEQQTLPAALLDTGMPFLVPEWVWVVEPVSILGPFDPVPPQPFALIVTSFSHGWLVLWRVLALSPLPPAIPLNWFLEAFPQVFAEVRLRGCVGFMTLLADSRPQEVKMARIITRLAKGGIVPFQGSLGAGMLN